MAERKKYARLAHGEAMWRHDKAGINLTAYTTDSIKNKDNLIKVEDIPKEFLPDVDLAVQKGVLDYVNKPSEDYTIRATDKPVKPFVQSTTGKFVWTDDGKGKPGKVLKTPSFSYRSIGFDSDSALYKKAFSILSRTPSKTVTEIQAILASLDKRVDKLEFVEACYNIEKEGKNPSMHPRGVVMDYLNEVLNRLGKSTGIGSIKVEEEPPVKDRKAIRIMT